MIIANRISMLKNTAGLLLISAVFAVPLSMAADKTRIKDIKFNKLKDYARLTIFFTGAVEYSKNSLSNPERLLFELQDTIISKKTAADFTAQGEIPMPVMIGQFDEDTVIIVLYLEKVTDVKESLLADPARLVIDIYTAAVPLQPAKKEADVISPQPQKAADTAVSIPQKETGVAAPPIKPGAPAQIKEDYDNLVSSGKRYDRSGDYEMALIDFKRAADLSPGNAELEVLIGDSLFRLGRRDEAHRAYKQAIEHDPNSADAYSGLGYIYYADGNPGSAVNAFFTAIQLDPDHTDAHAGLGYTYLTIGAVNPAIEQYRVLKTIAPDKADDLFQLIFKMPGKAQQKNDNQKIFLKEAPQ